MEGEDDEEEGEGEENDEDDDEEDEDEDFEVGDDEVEDDEKHALLNLVLGEVLKKFRAENGRGPDSEELLELRRQVASKLGVQLDEPEGLKRSAEDVGNHEPTPKKVKFTGEGDAEEADDDDDDDDQEEDSKPAAATASTGDGDKKPAAE